MVSRTRKSCRSRSGVSAPSASKARLGRNRSSPRPYSVRDRSMSALLSAARTARSWARGCLVARRGVGPRRPRCLPAPSRRGAPPRRGTASFGVDRLRPQEDPIVLLVAAGHSAPPFGLGPGEPIRGGGWGARGLGFPAPACFGSAVPRAGRRHAGVNGLDQIQLSGVSQSGVALAEHNQMEAVVCRRGRCRRRLRRWRISTVTLFSPGSPTSAYSPLSCPRNPGDNGPDKAHASSDSSKVCVILDLRESRR